MVEWNKIIVDFSSDINQEVGSQIISWFTGKNFGYCQMSLNIHSKRDLYLVVFESYDIKARWGQGNDIFVFLDKL